IDHLLARYGGLVDDLLALVRTRRALAAPLTGAEDYLAAEVVYAVTHEGARHLDDVLTRRTRISIETFDRGVAAAPHAARLMAEILDWDDARVAEEVDHYLRRVEAERQSQRMLTDQEADEARVQVTDLV
ncbi:MAG: glycerol-3-phosphate dehydrogenase, partial [Actinobacteria bacterium]|nr:glycerol-3-phosphate dehydrogenase [Actinomycetota bacterium]